ncbi:ABC transporter substrate-binding protein [Aquipseudomonas ullengensis]|uniref:ABC transporter substrate-binding protein n=1 Tax=Aquipseudomonas ullengensis TaxID=2759166 RepID=A0A7W4QDM3_9GAMM|nr:ABC transporter substrate-binding protein [Pseudomonas ullengensis]MBB2494703.1 ABC transporter substrate-binding protein [Pseudomonas ullengensis]
MTSVFTASSLRKTLLGVSLATAAGVLSLSAQAMETMKIGTVVWVGQAPFYIADKLDLYKAHGLKVELQFFNDPTMVPPAMMSGALDGGTLTYDQVVASVAKGIPQRAVLPIDFSNGGDAIVAEKSITSVQDFKGKKVGFSPLSTTDFLLAYALKSHGMSSKDIISVNLSPEAIPSAMASGSLPIGVTYEPNVSQTVNMPGDKYHVVYSSKDAPGLITDVLAFEEGVIAKRPEAIKALLKGYLDGLAYMQSHPDESAQIIAKVLGVTPAEAKEQLSGVYNIPLHEMGKNFEKSDATTSFYGSGAVIADLLKANGQIPVIPDFADTFDAQFVEALSQ